MSFCWLTRQRLSYLPVFFSNEIFCNSLIFYVALKNGSKYNDTMCTLFICKHTHVYLLTNSILVLTDLYSHRHRPSSSSLVPNCFEYYHRYYITQRYQKYRWSAYAPPYIMILDYTIHYTLSQRCRCMLLQEGAPVSSP